MSRKPRVWVSRPTFDDVIRPLTEYFEVRVEPVDGPLPHADLIQRLAESDAAIIGTNEHIGTREVAQATRLRIVANLSVGYDNLDIPALTAAGIVATNTANSLNDSVADFTWALMLGAARRVGEADRWVRAGHWQRPLRFHEWYGTDIHGRTLGILGMGHIGQAVARRAVGFDMPVIYHNRSRLDPVIESACNARHVDMPTLLREADILVVLVPRTAQTHHVIGAPELARMKRGAVLVNVARGGVVDESALVAALSDGRLAAAGLDVFEGEPAIHPPLRELDNVLLSPHIASATAATRRTMTATAVTNVLAVFGHGTHAGHPPNIINPEVLAPA